MQKSYDSVFCNYLRYRSRYSFNSIIIIVGDKRMGKSHLACALGQMLDEDFTTDKIVFDLKSFLEHVEIYAKAYAGNKRPKPCWIVFEEIGVMLDKYYWQSMTNRIFGQVSETYGKLGINLIMTLPKLEFLSKNGIAMCDFFINMLRRGIGRIYINRKYPMDIHGKFRTPCLGHIVDASPTKELWNAYEKMKLEYLSRMSTEWKGMLDVSKMKDALLSNRIKKKFEAETTAPFEFDVKGLLV